MIVKTEEGGFSMRTQNEESGINISVNRRRYAIEVLRIFLGGLLFYKGFYFVENISDIYTMIEDSMQISPFILAHYVVVAHLVGGFMLAVGLLTRIAALIQLPVLIGAVFIVHARDILMVTASELEYSLVILVLLIVFLVYGSGKWSVDHLVQTRKEKKEQP